MSFRQKRAQAVGVLLVAALIAATDPAIAVGTTTQQGPARVYVESVSLQSGGVATSQVLLLTADEPVSELGATVHFDSVVLEIDDVLLDAQWENAEPFAIGAGRFALRIRSSKGCPAAGSCRVGEIRWRGLAPGSATVRVTEVQLGREGQPVESEGSETRVGVGPPSQQALPDDSLEPGLGLMVLALLGLVAAALGVPFARLVLRVRRVPPVALDPLGRAGTSLNDQLVEAATGYLDAFELAGHVEEEPDAFFETLARQSGPAQGHFAGEE